MSNKGNRFGIGPVEIADIPSRRARDPGPMGVAVREAATSAQDASEALVEQRRQNAADARAWREAHGEGRVLVPLALDQIDTSDLPRDRLDLDGAAASDEMDELKASIRARGQREPVEVFRTADGRYELKKGWRRLTALRQLHAETGDARFAAVVARVTMAEADRVDLYIDMVEENVIRQDLSFAEMAQIAISLARDPQAGVADAEAAVGRLYRSLHKVKRAYIRSFVALMQALGDALPFPKAVPRDLGVDVARRLGDGLDAAALAARLRAAPDAEAQNRILREALTGERTAPVAGPRQKLEFRVGDSKITARDGECRIKAGVDFAALDRRTLDRAVRAFLAALSERDG